MRKPDADPVISEKDISDITKRDLRVLGSISKYHVFVQVYRIQS
jgi:hypothetical protein